MHFAGALQRGANAVIEHSPRAEAQGSGLFIVAVFDQRATGCCVRSFWAWPAPTATAPCSAWSSWLPIGTPCPLHGFQPYVLTAPDVPRKDVESLIEAASRRAERVTLNASRKDKALGISKAKHKYERLGKVYGFPHVLAGMDSIDASDVRTDFLVHTVFVRNSHRAWRSKGFDRPW
jgi:hypothetical protein